jgi:hypothetical protein
LSDKTFSDEEISAPALILKFKITAKLNNNSKDKKNFCLIIPPPRQQISTN